MTFCGANSSNSILCTVSNCLRITPHAGVSDLNLTFIQSCEMPNLTPRKAHKSQQFWYQSQTKLTKKTVLENECLQLLQNRLVYAQKSYISCAKPSQDRLNLAKMPVFPHFLPQPANIFTWIHPSNPRHFATLPSISQVACYRPGLCRATTPAWGGSEVDKKLTNIVEKEKSQYFLSNKQMKYRGIS